MPLNRREFIGTVGSAVAASTWPSSAQTPSTWTAPVLDAHLHLRRDPGDDIVHMDGCGVRKAIILARDSSGQAIRGLQEKHPGRVAWAATTDITTEGAESRLTQAVKDGAIGFGELKFHVAADSAELQRMYALAADLDVPILVHFQELPHFDGEGVFATGFKQFAAMLTKYPKTKFIGHADAFWANVDARYANDVAYPTGPITRGGVTDVLLGDYENLFGDLSANSGNNAMSRDPAFTGDFLRRHQNKLIFGSDCSCADGQGGGVSQANNPAAARLAGKCVARETLTLLQNSATADVFRKLTWENAHRLFRLSPSL
jgi:predicted TIM-barrel fold metal-dependent hydrolase